MSREPVAIYARVSTRDGRQTLDNQLREIGDFANRRNWRIVAEYTDEDSGARRASQRAGLAQLLRDAAQRKFERVIVWSLDRLTREGIPQTFEYLRQLRAADVIFHSYTEPHFSTEGPGAELLLAVAAWIAEHERTRLKDRINAGLETARRKGKKLGRPAKAIDAEALDACQGVSTRAAAKALGVSNATVQRRRKTRGNPMQIETYRATFRQPVIAGHQIQVKIKDPIEVELYQAGRGWKARNVKNRAEYSGLSAAMLNSQKTAVEALFEEKLIDWQPYDKNGRPSIPAAASA